MQLDCDKHCILNTNMICDLSSKPDGKLKFGMRLTKELEISSQFKKFYDGHDDSSS